MSVLWTVTSSTTKGARLRRDHVSCCLSVTAPAKYHTQQMLQIKYTKHEESIVAQFEQMIKIGLASSKAFSWI